MSARLYDRLAAAVSVLLLAVLATTTYYLAEMADRSSSDDTGRKQQHVADYFVENFQLTRLNPHGDPIYRLTAKRLEHFPDDDSITFTNPRMFSLDDKKPLVTVRADRGRSTSSGIETHLYDNVVLTRAGSNGNPPMKVESNYMLLLSEEDIAKTDKPVRITYGDSVLNGVGMIFNNDTRQLDLQSQVRGTWIAPPPKSKKNG